jgi:glutamine phosphoribosylpyrophosphate amidotransferase
VHNGIIENYDVLRQELESKGYSFKSDTDTEVLTLCLSGVFSVLTLSTIVCLLWLKILMCWIRWNAT